MCGIGKLTETVDLNNTVDALPEGYIQRMKRNPKYNKTRSLFETESEAEVDILLIHYERKAIFNSLRFTCTDAKSITFNFSHIDIKTDKLRRTELKVRAIPLNILRVHNRQFRRPPLAYFYFLHGTPVRHFIFRVAPL